MNEVPGIAPMSIGKVFRLDIAGSDGIAASVSVPHTSGPAEDSNTQSSDMNDMSASAS